MKKVAIISLAAMMAVGFAFEPKFNATIQNGMNLSSGSSWGFVNKSRLYTSAKVSDATSFTLEQDLTALSVPIFAYVDAKTAIGSLRVGQQLLLGTNLYGGVLQDSLFFSKTKVVGTGISYGTSVAGMDLGLGFTGGINSAARTITAKLGTKLGDNKLTVNGKMGTTAGGSNGFGLGADLSLDIGAIDGYAQAYMDLDDASAAIFASGTARQFVAGGLSTTVSGMKVYADAAMGLNTAGKSAAGLGCDQTIVGGVILPVNADTRLDINATMTTATGGGSTTTTIAGALEVKI